jgi:hypothetical protein
MPSLLVGSAIPCAVELFSFGENAEVLEENATHDAPAAELGRDGDRRQPLAAHAGQGVRGSADRRRFRGAFRVNSAR